MRLLLILLLASCKPVEYGIIKYKMKNVDQLGHRHSLIILTLKDSVYVTREVSDATFHMKQVGDRIRFTHR